MRGLTKAVVLLSGAAAVAVAVMPGVVEGSFAPSPGFSVAASPVYSTGSTIVSVAVDPSSGGIVASDGFGLSQLQIGGGTVTTTPLSFTNSHTVVSSIKYDPAGRLNLLTLDWNAPAQVMRSAGGGAWSTVATLDPEQHFTDSMAFDSAGHVLVTGRPGNFGDPAWLHEFDAGGTTTASLEPGLGVVDVARGAGDAWYLATFDGGIYRLSGGAATLVSHIDSSWVGWGAGFVTCLAVDNDDNVLVGVNLGQRFGMNSSAVLRVSAAGGAQPVALGYGYIAEDMTFSPTNSLLMAAWHPTEGARVYELAGNFAVPEPTTAAILAVVAGQAMLSRRRRHA